MALERSAYIRALRVNELNSVISSNAVRTPVFLPATTRFPGCQCSTSELFKYTKDELMQMELYDLFARREAADSCGTGCR